MKLRLKLLFFLAAIAVSEFSYSQIAIPNASAISQNFDGIGTLATASLPANWKMSAAGDGSPTWAASPNTTTTQAASSGTPSTGGRYNWGNGTTTSDRAIGFMTSGSYASPNSVMSYFQNTSGQELTALSISFDYERYRINTANASVSFFFSTDGSTWTAYSAGDSGTFAIGANAYNFTTGTVVSRAVSVTGLSIPNNGVFYLRWNFDTTGASSQGIGLDNFSLTPTLTPLGPYTIAPGNWNATSTWYNGVLPTATDATVTVNHAVTMNVPVTRNAGTNTIIASTGSIDMTNAYTSNGTTTVNGSMFVKNGITLGGGSTFRINGDFYINASGNFTAGSPTYGPASTLFYSTGGVYGRGFEWYALGVGTIGTTAGYPNNVRVTGNTTIDYNNGGGTANAKALAGNLTIDAGSSFYMDYGPNPNNGALTVAGNLVNNGNLTLGDASGDDLVLSGNFTNTGTFNGNNRAVIFSAASGTQTISSTSALTIPYVNFGASGNRTVQLASNLTISAPASGNAVAFNSASDVFNLSGFALTIGSTGVANAISGNGTFLVNATSDMTLLGTGSIGTLNFNGATPTLRNLTVNRTSGAVAAVLGTPLTVANSLSLTSGIIDTGAQILTLGAAATVVSTASNFIIADASVGGSVRKLFSAAGTFMFPIGDAVAPFEYSPVSVTGSGGTYNTTTYVSASVNDSQHPSFDAVTNYITRYWNILSNITGSPAISATATYVDADIVGTESVFQGNRWNGTAWTNPVAPVNAATNSFTVNNLAGSSATNQITAGLRSPEINVQVGGTNYLTASTYNFGTVLTSATNAVTFTVQNLGQQTLNLSAATFTGSPNYSYTTAYASTVNGLTTTTFVVTFNPTVGGTLTGSISIPNNDPTGGENPYVINFTGVGEVPAPEIRVERSTGSEIPSGSLANTGYSTIWAGQVIGTPAAPRTFAIRNIGTAALNVSSITVTGAHPTDFSVTASAPYTIGVSTAVNFTITFTPSASGTRTATISIANNDSDENPYTFNVEGTGDCDTATNTVTPASGPVGTELTITATANNLTGATVTFNGVAATSVTQVSVTQIRVIVPAGATSGAMVTTNAQGCQASNIFEVVSNHVATCQGSASGQPSYPTQLFISEVTDSNYGALTYVEVYNPAASSVSLTNYSIRVANNGAGYSHTVPLTGSIAASGTLVVALGNTGVSCGVTGGNGSLATISSTQGSINFGSNDDDHIALFLNATSIDHWGVFGDSNWAPNSIGANGVVFRRKVLNTVLPTTIYSDLDWDILDIAGSGASSCSNNDYSNVGTYDFSRGIPPVVTMHPSVTPSCKEMTLTVVANEGFVGGYPLAYQWYAVAPGAAIWTQLTNNALYSGVTSAALLISDVSTLAGYQFYCRVLEDQSTCYTASNAVKIDGVQTVTWNGSGWSPSTPDSSKVATINGSYNTATNGSFSACSLTVASGTLSVGSGNYVSVENNLTVNTGATMQVLDNGSLVMASNSGVVTNNGTMRMEREATPFLKYDYTYWSSPMNNSNLGTTFTGWRTDYAFYFNTANFADIAPADGYDDDGNVWTNASGTLTPGRGYAIMGPTTAPSYPIAPMVSFAGTYNNGVITRALQLSANTADSFDDYNLIGNPYPCALLADQFVSDNPDISGTLYFWTHRTPIAPASGTNNFITSDYAMYTPGSGGVASSNGGATPNGFVASGQGFFVEADLATQVTFNNQQRSILADNTNFYRISADAASGAERNRLWLNLEHANGLFSQQLFAYVDGATNSFDRGYDGRVSKTQNTVSFYSIMDDANYRIQGRPVFDASDVVPLGFSTTFASDYFVAIDHAEGVFLQPDQPVYLEDKWLNVFHDLQTGPYTFSTETGQFDSRFQLRYSLPLGVEVPTNDQGVVVTSRPGWFGVKSTAEMVRIEVADVLGRNLFTSGEIQTNLLESDLNTKDAVVLVRIWLKNGNSVVKKVRI